MADATWYVEVYTARAYGILGERFRFRVVSTGNHEPLAQSEGYKREADALHAAHLIADPAGADVLQIVGTETVKHHAAG